ncbi:O-methylsterigmatocystin oxidoreductase [Grifola frondosa]|uniref:O-methylsterigmatocystin oxidoreductase n=1 Tax=Grifola frondosa TaxID=5627 RepID=A0A1C7LS71_GRIFR|nr:O-methylsterigmatocystin oxidoreductase [Grifola frondosa]
MASVFVQSVLILIITFLVSWWKRAKRANHNANLPLPPGPTPLPVVGNVFDVPKEYSWLAYGEMSERYGDLVHLRALGQSIIIAGSSKVALDLFEKRSSTYSDRGQSIMVILTGWEWNLGLLPYGKYWRRIRRTFHQYFHQLAIPKYSRVQLRESRRFLHHLLTSPDKFVAHIRFAFGATLLKIVYGIELAEDDTEYTRVVESALEGAIEGLVPGRFWVEFLPFLRHIPSWIPGAGSQKKLATWRADAHAMRDVPYAVAKHAYNSYLEGDSAVQEEDIAKNAVGVAYAAGADTTYSTMQWFFFAMLSHPEVQQKAQAELDAVVGPDRLPDFGDRDSLPYVNAIALECFRWQPVVPLGVPHRSMADDEYDGYSIPSGSMIIPNIWAFTRDTDVYAEPERFNPDRFIKDGRLDPNVKDPRTLIFGFGRRICPGRHLADASLFINVASVLHVYDIGPPLNANGEPIRLEPTATSGFLS